MRDRTRRPTGSAIGHSGRQPSILAVRTRPPAVLRSLRSPSTGNRSMMKLYVSPASPFGRKASVVIAELGLGDRVVQEPATVTPVTRNADVARGNPLAKIPTLLLDDGTALYDSPVICEYLDQLSGAPRFFPAAGATRWTAL